MIGSELNMNTQQQLAGTFTAADASPDMRAAFIRRTYQHLAMAILAFVALEFVLFKTGIAYSMAAVMTKSTFGCKMITHSKIHVFCLHTRPDSTYANFQCFFNHCKNPSVFFCWGSHNNGIA